MPLASNMRLGPYQIVGPLGAGGMGEVYKALDTRLNRTVAIKVLPTHTASRPEARERFEREARAVSALNHPHICVLHDVGSQDGVDYLVMEFVEGETLAQRLARGPLRFDEALAYAAQVADALNRAHRLKIIHRDLKPGNIMLGKDGTKLLDFGLAKLHAAAAAGADDTRTLELTKEGSIVGTVQYMAPEQLEGKEADPRSDIFAFGALLYEMLTGRKAFEGKSTASITAAIRERNPPAASQMQPLSTPLLDQLIQSCLAKDPDERRQNMQDVLLDLQWIAGDEARVKDTQQSSPGRRRELMRWAAGAMVLLAAGIAWTLLRPSTPRARVTRFSIPAPEGGRFGGDWYGYTSVAISPDGAHVAFAGTRKGVTQIYLRAMGDWEAHALPGSEGGAHSPLFT